MSGLDRPYFVPRSPSAGRPYIELSPNDPEQEPGAAEVQAFKPIPFANRGASQPRGQPAQRGGFWAWLAGGQNAARPQGATRSQPAVKVDAKVFFANERTFMSWVHVSIVIASMSVTIVMLAEQESPAGNWAKVFGVMLMPVAIGFVVYALLSYLKRTQMLLRRDPGPYNDSVGPVILGGVFLTGVIASAFVKYYTIYYW